MKLTIFCLAISAILFACANDSNNTIGGGPVYGPAPGNIGVGAPGQQAYDRRMMVLGRVDNSTGATRFEEPRFNDGNGLLKIWAYGPIFSELGDVFSEHMNAACALLAGPGSQYETHVDSVYVPYGEFGVVFGSQAGFQSGLKIGRFGDYDYPYWPSENSKYVQSITCKVNGGNIQPNKPYGGYGRGNYPQKPHRPHPYR